MGQIQNALLNSLGSVQQMIQMYKLTDAYAKQQEDNAKERAEKAAQQKFEQAEERRLRNRTAQQIEADILATPFTEEEEKKLSEKYKDLENASPGKRGSSKSDLTDSIRAYVGDFTDPKYAELIRERAWLDKKYPAKKRQGKAKAQKSAQEQADTNENIEIAKNTIKGGNQ